MIDMIRIVATDHRFAPRLVAECSVCSWRGTYGESLALATLIARAQEHVTSRHDDALPTQAEVGLPGVTGDRYVLGGTPFDVADPSNYDVQYAEYECDDLEPTRDHESQASDLGKRDENIPRSRTEVAGVVDAGFFR